MEGEEGFGRGDGDCGVGGGEGLRGFRSAGEDGGDGGAGDVGEIAGEAGGDGTGAEDAPADGFGEGGHVVTDALPRWRESGPAS